MSEPKKYEYVSDGYTARFINAKTGHAAPYGEYVLHSDYERLKAEVERLNKAGDAMWNALLCSGCSECMGMYDCHEDGMKAWNAAKEGKPHA
jgi:hypothetical protein